MKSIDKKISSPNEIINEYIKSICKDSHKANALFLIEITGDVIIISFNDMQIY